MKIISLCPAFSDNSQYGAPSADNLPYGAPSADNARSGPETAELSPENEYRAGRRIGVLTLGTEHLFFRKFPRVYSVPYEAVSRYFRRVLEVPVKLGCCGGDLQVEHIVICTKDASGERELVQIQLPGAKAARIVMDELSRLAPHAAAGKASVSDSGKTSASDSDTGKNSGISETFRRKEAAV